jgi:hypothetical protein
VVAAVVGDVALSSLGPSGRRELYKLEKGFTPRDLCSLLAIRYSLKTIVTAMSSGKTTRLETALRKLREQGLFQHSLLEINRAFATADTAVFQFVTNESPFSL